VALDQTWIVRQPGLQQVRRVVLHQRGDFRDEHVNPQPRLGVATKGEELFELVEDEQRHRARPRVGHRSVEILPQRLRPLGSLARQRAPERLAHLFGLTKKQRYFAFVKTVNLTIDEGTWRAARRLAAERDTSVSALVREALEHLTKTNDRREEARREIQAMIGSFGGRVGTMPSREKRNARR
jgi:hypothetical protein